MLLEDDGFQVLRAENAETAQVVLEEAGSSLSVMVADNRLSGEMEGSQLAHYAHAHYPRIKVIIVSGKDVPYLPPGTQFFQKPWQPLEMLRAVH